MTNLVISSRSTYVSELFVPVQPIHSCHLINTASNFHLSDFCPFAVPQSHTMAYSRILCFLCVFAVLSFVSVIDSLAGKNLIASEHMARKNENSTVKLEKSTLILAANRTFRRDPLYKFRYYKGGWNITNTHYFSSVGFTAAPLFVIATIWFGGFGIALCSLSIHHFCKKKVDVKFHPHAYTISLVLLIIFTCGGIAGSIMLYNGQGKFHHSIMDTMEYIVNEAGTTVENLRNMTVVISLALVHGVDEIFLSVADQEKVDSLNRKLKTAANDLESKTNENSFKIKRVLETMRMVLVILAAVMLLVAFFGLLFSLSGYKVLVYSLVLIAWLLVTAAFLLSGVFVLLTNVVGDACVSMDEWTTHPNGNTSLDQILPCVDMETAKQSLTQSKEVSYEIVSVMNIAINNIFNSDQLGSSILNYSQSGPSIPTLCNPYTSQLERRTCAEGEISLEGASEALKNYTCFISSSGNCGTSGRLTPGIYDELVLAAQISYGLYRYAPFLIALEDCSFVRETFGTITSKYCPDLCKQLRWVYIGLAFVATGIMLSLVFWIVYSKQRRRRVEYYCKHPFRNNTQFLLWH